MGSLFSKYHDRLNASVLAVNGEPADVLPRVAGQYSTGSADPDRPITELVVVPSIAPGVDKITGTRFQVSDVAGGSKVAVSPSEIWIAKSELARLAFELRQNDAIRLKDRPGAPVFGIVSAPQANHQGDVRLLVSFEG